jgi:geranylgeranyl pyrophosphate synthase
MGTLLLAGGKRLRPRLAELAARLGPRFDEERAKRLGVALEFLHTATLVHDDIVDESPLRRGCPTVHMTYGRATAARVGVYYFARCYQLMAGLGLTRLTCAIMDAVLQLGVGEYEEYVQRGQQNFSIRRYVEIASRKTAALIAAVCAAGGILGGADRATVTALRRFGHFFGLAFQIVDDVLDFKATAGKAPGQDGRQGVLSHPVICALEQLPPAVATRLLQTAEAGDIAELNARVDSSHALERSLKAAAGFMNRALAALDGLPDTAATRELRALADFVLTRDH